MTDAKKPLVSRRTLLGFAATTTLGAGLLNPVQLLAAPTNPPNKADNTLGVRTYNIRDYGAKGDGQTLDTKAIQAAIDACFKDKGGTVLVPEGVFVTGTIEMKSNVTLHIAAQGKILGTTDGTQYYAASAIPTTGEWTMGDGNVGLIFAANADNITIEGTGTIDGQGAQFRAAVRGGVPPSGIGGNKRPHHLLFYKCKNLTVRNIYLTACAYHSVRVCVCSYVKLDGIRIYSRVNGNNDGFHFISCEYVHLSNSDVKCQDDACALFGANKFVTITGCTFSTRWSVFRFGGGHSENITVSNCIIHDTFGCPIKMRCDHRSHFENISFSNIVMKNVTGPISIGLGPQNPKPGETPPRPGVVRNISFHNIQATVVKPFPIPDIPIEGKYNPGEIFSSIILNGMDEGFLENISFHDVQVTFPGGGTAEQGAVRDVPKVASEYYVIGVSPAFGLFARNVRGLTLTNVRFRVESEDHRPAIIFDHVVDATLQAVCVDGSAKQESVLRFIECTDILVAASRLLTPASVFLQVEGAGAQGIVVDGGDQSKAATGLHFKAGATKKGVRVRS